MISSPVIDVTDQTFAQDVLEASKERPVVVDFWAPWCGPCRMLGPVLERLAQEADGAFVLAKVNVDLNPRTAEQFQVQGIPAVKAFRDGQVVAEFVGAQPEPMVRQFLQRLNPSPAESFISQGQRLLAAGQWPEAAAAFEAALAEEPRNAAAIYGLAVALLRQGEGCRAQSHLTDFPLGPQARQAAWLLPLAQWLCRQSQAEPAPKGTLAARYQQAARLVQTGQYQAAMEEILALLAEDKSFGDGEPKNVMLGLFTLIGDRDPLVDAYRRRLASLLW